VGELVDAYIALGGNVGDVLRAFRTALAAMPRHGIDVIRVSTAYRTRAVTERPDQSAPDYWNAACHARTELEPHALLGILLKLERDAGRVRWRRWEPRTLDLDLLLYGDRSIDTDALTVPHPRMQERSFVLQPLAELDPALSIHGVPVGDALRRLSMPAGGIIGRRAIQSRRRVARAR
jgi:2-amino-4-hydroxy-6-hydroxymethyldihydropteridine diphosphokinase